MPVFGFTEQRLHPYPPLAQCFLVGEGATVALDLIHVALLKVAQHLATCLVVGASGSQRAGVAGARHGLVDDLVSGGSEGLRREDLARWTLVDVQFGVVGELLLAEIGSCFACSGQRHIGSNACLLYGGDVLRGAIGGVPGDLLWVELPPEAGAPEQVEHRRIFRNLKGRDQSIEDDPRLAAVHDVVVVVAEVRTLALPAFHRGGVGVGCTSHEVPLAPVPHAFCSRLWRPSREIQSSFEAFSSTSPSSSAEGSS